MFLFLMRKIMDKKEIKNKLKEYFVKNQKIDLEKIKTLLKKNSLSIDNFFLYLKEI